MLHSEHINYHALCPERAGREVGNLTIANERREEKINRNYKIYSTYM